MFYHPPLSKTSHPAALFIYSPLLSLSPPSFSLLISMACMNLLHARYKNLIVLVLAFVFLLMSTSTPFQFMAQGRRFHNAHMIKNEEVMIEGKMRVLIGSRPPKCEKRCRNCGQCAAVQVPISRAIKFLNFGKSPIKSIQYSRGDDISSYKPMCWKCKCGNFFFNP